MKFGWKKSSGKLSVPEFKASGSLIKLASTSSVNEHIIPEYTPVSNQGPIGTCAANSGCDMWEILYGLDHPAAVPQLSRLFLYWNARVYDLSTGRDDGVYIHNVMDSLTKTGVCRETTWPYIVANVFAQPNQIAYKEGDDNTFDSFCQITSYDDQRLDDIELAIRANHPVIFGTSVGDELMNYDGNPNTVFNLPRKSNGGHAMLITGVRTNSSGKRDFLIRNSWGSGWGLLNYPGHVWFSSDYIKSDETRDLFIGTRMIDLLL